MIDTIKELLLNRFHFGEQSDCIKVDCPIGFTGATMDWFTNTAPKGWLIMDGSSLLVANYPNLFALIGYTYGGSGANFSLPNTKGKVLVGRDSADASFDTLGETGGAKTHTLIIAEMPTHHHNPIEQDNGADLGVPGGGTGGYAVTTGGTIYANSINMRSVGGGGAHNNLQPYLVCNKIIKY
jgi:microcystin-dependent protein